MSAVKLSFLGKYIKATIDPEAVPSEVQQLLYWMSGIFRGKQFLPGDVECTMFILAQQQPKYSPASFGAALAAIHVIMANPGSQHVHMEVL